MLCLDKLPNPQPQEKVQIFLRRHWIELIKIAAYTFMMLLVPAAILAILQFADFDVGNHPVWGPATILFLASYLLIVFIITITEITDYWLDVWIVTNERIINGEQHGLFNRLVSEVHLEQIQDITSETKGFLETFMTYGDVYIQTAAQRERFRFKNIDNPDAVKIAISQLVTVCKNTHHHDPKTVASGLGSPAAAEQRDAHIKI